MSDQPTSQQVEPKAEAKDSVIREVVNDLCIVAKQWHGSQQLRDRIACVVARITKGQS